LKQFWDVVVKNKWLILTVAIFALGHILLFTKGLESGGPDMETYHLYASRIVNHLAPYRDFSVEYPPGSLLVFLIPFHFAPDLTAYGHAFTLELLAFDLIGLLMITLLARRFKVSVWVSLLIYTLSMLAINIIGIQRYDMVPAIITLAALCAFSRGHYKTAWLLVALGTMTKLFPILLVPLFLIYQWKNQRWQSLLASVGVFAIAVFWIALPFYNMGQQGFIKSFTVQGSRNLQVESTYASVLLMGAGMGLTQAGVYQGPMSFDLESPLAKPIAKETLLIMAISILAVCAFYFFSYRGFKNPHLSRPPPAAEMAHLFNYAFLIILVMMLTNKVLSPQYMVWLYPLVPLITGRARHPVWLIFVVASWLTWYIYPANYIDLINREQTLVSALFLRNVMLVLMAVWLLGEPRTTEGASREQRRKRG
jgi:uncharacterized membrane protein